MRDRHVWDYEVDVAAADEDWGRHIRWLLMEASGCHFANLFVLILLKLELKTLKSGLGSIKIELSDPDLPPEGFYPKSFFEKLHFGLFFKKQLIFNALD